MSGSHTSPAVLLRLVILGQDLSGCDRAEEAQQKWKPAFQEGMQCSTKLVANMSTPESVHT